MKTVAIAESKEAKDRVHQFGLQVMDPAHHCFVGSPPQPPRRWYDESGHDLFMALDDDVLYGTIWVTSQNNLMFPIFDPDRELEALVDLLRHIGAERGTSLTAFTTNERLIHLGELAVAEHGMDISWQDGRLVYKWQHI